MAKNIYFIVAVTNTEKTKRFAYVIRENGNHNMASIIDYQFDRNGNRQCFIEWLSPCESKTLAFDSADAWNSVWADRDELWVDPPLYYTYTWATQR